MKYIRTKDGRIIDLKNWLILETGCVNAETNEVKKDICYQRNWFEQHEDTCEYKTEHISHNTQVSKQADTIEELCDEFVWDNCLIVFTNKEKTQFVLKQAKAEYEEEYDINKDFDEDSSPIYGAIWTDKGLIYVAKMNDEGELELL